MFRLRIALLLVLSTSCVRPVYVEGPAVQGGLGTTPPPAMMRTGPVQLCHEVSRVRCDTERCKGRAMDLVTLQCSSGQLTRCEIGKGCE